MTPPDYEYLRKLLKDSSGLDLSADKQYRIESRLRPLSRKCGLPGISELVQKMKGGSAQLIVPGFVRRLRLTNRYSRERMTIRLRSSYH